MEDTYLQQPCHNCQGGRKHKKTVTLMTWLGTELVTVPDFPAWVCDICGNCSYDAHALTNLSVILNPEAGVPFQPDLPLSDNKPITKLPPAAQI